MQHVEYEIFTKCVQTEFLIECHWEHICIWGHCKNRYIIFIHIQAYCIHSFYLQIRWIILPEGCLLAHENTRFRIKSPKHTRRAGAAASCCAYLTDVSFAKQ